MRSKAAGVATGIAVIVFGFIIYPYWTTYVTTPLNDWLLNDFFPSIMETVPAWLNLILAISPFLTMALILFAGTMYIRNKLHGRKENE